MTEQEARALATRVAKESNGVSLKFGRTNGRVCLHLKNRDVRKSITIYSAPAWDECEWNFINRRKAEKGAIA